MTSRRCLRAAVGAFLAVAAAAAAAESGATAVVNRLNEALLGTLKDAQQLGYQGRYDRMAPAVDATYDVPFMAEKSLGAHWKRLGEADRRRWIELSREFSLANYAANFDHWGGQTIDLLGEEPAPNETTIVRTRINDPRGEPIEMSYRLRRTDAGWRIIDVYLKGTVSELALRRSDYAGVLKRDGFESLAKAMQVKIADLASGKAKR